MNKEALLSMIRGQERSTKMWCEQFAKNRDISSRINAAMAVGRLNGMLRIYLNDCAKEKSIPDSEIEAFMMPYEAVWEQLQRIS